MGWAELAGVSCNFCFFTGRLYWAGLSRGLRFSEGIVKSWVMFCVILDPGHKILTKQCNFQQCHLTALFPTHQTGYVIMHISNVTQSIMHYAKFYYFTTAHNGIRAKPMHYEKYASLPLAL
jgi:hypothetical protein